MSWTFQSVAVVGSGAIGLYYGARLAAAGEDVRFLLRLERVYRKGAKVAEGRKGRAENPINFLLRVPLRPLRLRGKNS